LLATIQAVGIAMAVVSLSIALLALLHTA